jgi:hypothetical protein
MLNIVFDNIRLAPCQRHSPTSRAAAVGIAPRAGTKRALVMDFLLDNPQGATDEEMQQCIPMSANTQRPRRVELLAAKLIKDSGRTRKTVGGDEAVVWVAVVRGE